MAGTLALSRAGLHRQPIESLTGGLAVVHGTWLFDTYATSGVSVTLVPSGQSVLAVSVHPVGGYAFEYVVSSSKLKAYAPGGTEVANATDLSGLGAIPFVAFLTRAAR